MTEKQFKVTIMRTESRNHTFIVQAEDKDQAEELAFEMSNDFDWKVSHSVHHADEQVVGVKEED
jgi:ribosomal protein S20